MSEGNGKYAPRPGHIPGEPVNLGGNDFVLAPFGLRLLREYQERLKALNERKDPPATPEEWYEVNCAALLDSLRRNYPDITREQLEPLLDSVNMEEAMAALFRQSGLKRVKPGEIKPGN